MVWRGLANRPAGHERRGESARDRRDEQQGSPGIAAFADNPRGSTPSIMTSLADGSKSPTAGRGEPTMLCPTRIVWGE